MDKYWLRLDRTQGLHCLLCRAAFIHVTELIETGEKKGKKKAIAKNIAGERRGKEGRTKQKKKKKKRTVSSRARRPWQARGGNDKSVAVIARDEKQHLSNEARQRQPLAPARKRGCAETTNTIIFMPALLFVRTGTHLRTWVYWLYDTRRAFGVDKRQPAGSHYPSQIDFSFVFPSG